MENKINHISEKSVLVFYICYTIFLLNSIAVKLPPPPAETYRNAYDAKFKYYMAKYNKILEQNKFEQERMLDKADKEAASTVKEQLKLQYGEDFYNSVILGDNIQSDDFESIEHMHSTPTEGVSIANKSV